MAGHALKLNRVPAAQEKRAAVPGTAALGSATANSWLAPSQPLQLDRNYRENFTNGFTDPSFFPFFTVFAFAMVLSLLNIFCFPAAYTAASAIGAPNYQPARVRSCT
jgi:hypothetical protein